EAEAVDQRDLARTGLPLEVVAEARGCDPDIDHLRGLIPAPVDRRRRRGRKDLAGDGRPCSAVAADAAHVARSPGELDRDAVVGEAFDLEGRTGIAMMGDAEPLLAVQDPVEARGAGERLRECGGIEQTWLCPADSGGSLGQRAPPFPPSRPKRQ